MLSKIVSGGQTGADRAALDFAIAHGLPHGGWCPKGRLAVDGPLDAKYLLKETPSATYRQRTEWNIRDSDGTLVVNLGRLDGGSLLTTKMAARLAKPLFILQPDEVEPSDFIPAFHAWLRRFQIGVLNVAGPREEKRPRIYAVTTVVMAHTIPLGERDGRFVTATLLEFSAKKLLDQRVPSAGEDEEEARILAARLLAKRAEKKLRP